VPILHEDYSFSPERVKDTEVTLTIDVICYKCPFCGQECFPDEAALAEHIKTAHPLQYYFWYWTVDNIPAGKLLLGTVLAGLGLTIIGGVVYYEEERKRMLLAEMR
jgi:hypothetical protein